jgi:DNA-directed RNA polymerase subunit F
LIDREIAGTLSIDESIELAKLQKAMLEYRRKVAPLPIEAARRLRKELLVEIGCEP